MKATFCKTKAGNGFKIAIGDKWFFASKKYLLQVIDGEANSCQFRTMDEIEKPLVETDSSLNEY